MSRPCLTCIYNTRESDPERTPCPHCGEKYMYYEPKQKQPMTAETTLAELYQAAKLSANYSDFEWFIKYRYFGLQSSAETPEIKVKLIIEQKGEKQ